MLELFSGVGGYHSALQIIEGKLGRHKLKVIGAVDINTVSNEVTLLVYIKIPTNYDRSTGIITRTPLVSRETSPG